MAWACLPWASRTRGGFDMGRSRGARCEMRSAEHNDARGWESEQEPEGAREDRAPGRSRAGGKNAKGILATRSDDLAPARRGPEGGVDQADVRVGLGEVPPLPR